MGQPEFKSDTQPAPAANAKAEDTQDHGLRDFMLFVSVLVAAFGCLIWFVLIPMSREAETRKELEYQAKLDGPKILQELLVEIKLLRIAVEKLHVQ